MNELLENLKIGDTLFLTDFTLPFTNFPITVNSITTKNIITLDEELTCNNFTFMNNNFMYSVTLIPDYVTQEWRCAVYNKNSSYRRPYYFYIFKDSNEILTFFKNNMKQKNNFFYE